MDLNVSKNKSVASRLLILKFSKELRDLCRKKHQIHRLRRKRNPQKHNYLAVEFTINLSMKKVLVIYPLQHFSRKIQFISEVIDK